MEFRQLEYFCTLSELENFTRTAETLHVSQPSVTKAIKALELELDLLLVDRRQKHVTLTEAGKEFYLHAQRIMQDVAEAKRDMQQFRNGSGGVVRVGVSPMVESYVFPRIYTAFHREYPEITLEAVEFGDSEGVKVAADQSKIDCGLLLLGPADTAADTENVVELGRDTMSVCLPLSHPLAGRRQLDFADLVHEHFILQRNQTYQHRIVYERCQQAGYTPNVLICTSQFPTIKQLVADGEGISVLPDFVTSGDRRIKCLALNPPVELIYVLYWGKQSAVAEAAERFRIFLQQRSQEKTGLLEKRNRSEREVV